MGTISDYLHLSEIPFVSSTTQKFHKKIIKTFLIKRFFPFATGINDTGGAPLAANTSANF
jgi:hypothetical protein